MEVLSSMSRVRIPPELNHFPTYRQVAKEADMLLLNRVFECECIRDLRGNMNLHRHHLKNGGSSIVVIPRNRHQIDIKITVVGQSRCINWAVQLLQVIGNGTRMAPTTRQLVCRRSTFYTSCSFLSASALVRFCSTIFA